MKRFGMYNDDFNNLFECYSQVNGEDTTNLIMTRPVEGIISEKLTYPGAKFVKVFTQKPGRGADLSTLGNIKSIDSDDGQGGVIISAVDGDKGVDVVMADDQCHVKIFDSKGAVEDQFITNIPVRFDEDQKEITIINIQEL